MLTPTSIRNVALTLDSASTTTVIDLITGAANGTQVQTISVTSTDSADRDVSLYLDISGTSYLVGTVAIPATSGMVGTVYTVDLMNLVNFPELIKDGNTNTLFNLGFGNKLQVQATTTITALKQIQFVVEGGDY